MEVSINTSTRGKPLLIVNMFTFSRQKQLKSGEVFWRCTNRRLNCAAKVFTLGPENTIIRSDLHHNHDTDEKKINRRMISNSCKRKAIEDISEKPSKIVCRELQNNLPATLTSNDIINIKKTIYSSRRKILPNILPKNVAESHQVLASLNLKTNRNEDFLFINNEEDNIVVFTCETNLRLLSEIQCVYMDGTFGYCLKFFYQLFTIHGFKNGHYIPLVFCLLTNKRAETYTKLFCAIKNEMLMRYNLIFAPSEVFCDFEMAIHTSINETWPTTRIVGCRFHLGQSWHRTIQRLGLSEEFQNKSSSIGQWLKLTFALSYLEPQEVGECFVEDLMSSKPLDDRVDKYVDYLVDNYIDDENAKFPPHIWANMEPENTIFKTTNACESYHAKFGGLFYNQHPSIYIFVEAVKQVQLETYVKIQSLHLCKKIKDKFVKQKLKTIVSITSKLRNREISRIDYLKCIKHLT